MNETAKNLADYFEKHLSNEAKPILESHANKMMFNAAMLVMSGRKDTNQAKNILRCYRDVPFVKDCLSRVLDRAVYDYWVSEVPPLMLQNPDAEKITKSFNDEFTKIATGIIVAPEARIEDFVDVLMRNKN